MNTVRSSAWALAAVVSLALVQHPATTTASDQIQWKNLGPGGGGNFFTVGVHPDNADLVLMGSDTGGFYRSADGGTNWKLVNEGLVDPGRFAAYNVQAYRFSFDPVNHDTVYAGTLKSTNAGLNWHETIKPYIITWHNAIPPAPNNNVVYAAGYANVYRSDCAWDGSPACAQEYSCSTLPNTGSIIRAMALDPDNPGHAIVCADTGLYESIFTPTSPSNCNGAWQWTKITNANLPHDDCNHMVIDAASHTLFIALATHTTSDCTGWKMVDTWKGGLYKATIPSTGTTWGSLTWSSINGADDASILTTRNQDFETGPDAGHPVAAYWNAESGTVTRDCVSTGGISHSGDCSMKFTMNATSPTYFVSDPIPLEAGGTTYRLSAWAKVAYPTTPGGCSQTVSGCSLVSSFHLRTYWYLDAEGTVPFAFPGYEFNNQNQVHDTIKPQFDTAINGGWRKFETIIPSRTGVASIRIEINNAGNCVGSSWVDDISLEPVHNLPRVGDAFPGYSYLHYGSFVIDPLDLNTLYTGTQFGSSFDGFADVAGVFKTTNGGTTWSLATRGKYQDNVRDGYGSAGTCGDGVCAGRGEKCDTCPEDCTTANPQMPPSGCCGDNSCTLGEHGDNTLHLSCTTDCPIDPDPDRNVGGSEYFDAFASGYQVWGLGIGSGAQGHNTVYFVTDQAYRSGDAGAEWTQVTADHQINSSGRPITWKPHGDASPVVTFGLATDSRAPGRLYYGDTDNYIEISYDDGESFAKEGAPDWAKLVDTTVTPAVPQPAYGDSCSSILLDKPYPGHAGSPDRIYAGIGTSELGGCPLCVGVAQGDFNPIAGNVNPWSWKPLGDQRTLPQTGGVDLARDNAGTFFAAVYGSGVYKLPAGATPSTAWTRACNNPTNCNNWNPIPQNWNTYRIAHEPYSGRLYVSAGNPYTDPQPAAETGVWASNNSGGTWNKISPASVDQEAIAAILPDGPSTLFIGSGYSLADNTTDGGLYRGVRASNGTWTWMRVLAQPRITGMAISPADSSILYAFSAQVCCYNITDVLGQQAGIWKSTDMGKLGTWGSAPLANNGLGYLGHGRLFFSETYSNKLFATTTGSGIFEGTISCADPVRDFECSTRIKPSNPVTLFGTVLSGTVDDLAAPTLDDTYQALKESGTSSNRKLTQVWTFTGAQASIPYQLRAEGFLSSNANDSFGFSFTTKSSGTCTGQETSTWTSLTPSLTAATPDDQMQIYSLGALPSGQTIFCVRVTDSLPSGDNQADTLTLDRVYLLPTPAP